MKKYLLLVFTLAFWGSVYSQDQVEPDSSIFRTIELQGVVIQGIPVEKYATGNTIRKYSQKQIENESYATLNEFLARNSTIYFKQHGNGMMASVSMRGTGASHTAVLWNGININSQTLGSLDFSLVPMAAIDKVEIHSGSASSLYGSDAIGGAVHLSSGNKWGKAGFSALFNQKVGSFNTYFSSGNVSYGTNKVYLKTNFYHKISENNFTFIERSTMQRQNHAAYNFYGIVQEAGIKLSPNQKLSFAGWFNFNDRQIQPNKQANLFPSNEEIQDKNIRTTLDYKLDNSLGFFNLVAGYVHDHQLYTNDNSVSKIATHRLVNLFQFEKDITQSFTIRAGGEWMHIITDVDSYEREIQETRTDGFVSLNYSPVEWIKTSVNLRKTFMKGHNAPLTPSFGSTVKIVNTQTHQLDLKALASKSYRIPTLNDRYWPLSGNKDLLPENGISYETGFVYGVGNQDQKLNIETSFYKMKVKDMIHWRPAGKIITEESTEDNISGDLWVPQNLRSVHVKGMEVQISYTNKLSKDLELNLSGNYAFTRSINQTPITSDDVSVGKQLPYVPKHSANLINTLRFGSWSGNLSNYYSGKRFTNLGNKDALEAYVLTNFDLAKTFHSSKIKFDLTFRVNNIFNVEYQYFNAKAMPGINYQAGIKFQL